MMLKRISSVYSLKAIVIFLCYFTCHMFSSPQAATHRKFSCFLLSMHTANLD